MSQTPKYSFLILLWCLKISITTIAQPFDSLFEVGLQLERNFNEKQALLKFNEAQKLNPSNLQILCKCSEICNRIGAREKNPKSKSAYFQSALAFAKKAHDLYPNNDESNVVMSMALGRIALTKSGEDKIALVKEIKSYADKAIRINASNFKAWHILGKWHYEISSLNFLEKTAIKLFYVGLPESTLDSSINAYEKAKALSNKFCLNYLELAKAYYKNDNYVKAVENLKILIKLPNTIEDDVSIKKEAYQLLKKWQ